MNPRKNQIVGRTLGALLILVSPFIGYGQYQLGRAVAHMVIERHLEKSPPVGLDDYELGIYAYVNLSVIAVVFLGLLVGTVTLIRSMPVIGRGGRGISK